jgi:thiamine monophosphate synthase
MAYGNARIRLLRRHGRRPCIGIGGLDPRNAATSVSRMRG